MATILTALALALPSFVLWNLIHETSHALFAQRLAGAVTRIKPWPHRVPPNGSWVFAATYYDSIDKKLLALPRRRFWISLAPRIPDAVACLLVPVGLFLDGPWQAAWFVLLGAGAVDNIVGIIGASENSDLKKAANAYGWNPWLLRLVTAIPLILLAAALTLLA